MLQVVLHRENDWSTRSLAAAWLSAWCSQWDWELFTMCNRGSILWNGIRAMNLEFLLCTVPHGLHFILAFCFEWINGVCMYHTLRTFVTPRSTCGYVPIISANSLCLNSTYTRRTQTVGHINGCAHKYFMYICRVTASPHLAGCLEKYKRVKVRQEKAQWSLWGKVPSAHGIWAIYQLGKHAVKLGKPWWMEARPGCLQKRPVISSACRLSALSPMLSHTAATHEDSWKNLSPPCIDGITHLQNSRV